MENTENKTEVKTEGKNQLHMAGAIVLAGVLIAGAILLKDGKPSAPTANEPTDKKALAKLPIKPISDTDYVLGAENNTDIVMIEYADFQCPFCGKFFSETATKIKTDYVDTGKIKFVYRDFAFLGAESKKSSEASRCAGDQGKFWEYHDYLFTHQDGENDGAFADKNLKAFAKTLKLNSSAFDTCLDSGKYTQAVEDANIDAGTVGVNGTPHSFIVKNGKVVDEITGAYPYSDVSAKLDAVLK